MEEKFICVFLGYVVILILNHVDFVNTQVVGCGGFVKASNELAVVMKGKTNYSFIKVGLYTQDGVLKESSECAPNGYYFIPIYDKGSFKLKVHGPDGWNFEPSEVVVSIQDDNQCEGGKDLNFEITGFTVTGRVHGTKASSKDLLEEGPAGVTVTLTTKGVSRAVVTSKGGAFTFRNIFPATYSLVASHPAWSFSRPETKVSFEWGNFEVPLNSLAVSGYDLQGRVEAGGGEPVSGVQFFLYSDTLKEADCPKLSSSQLPGKYGKPLCGTTSDATGKFIMKGVPSGTFKLVPFYQGNFTTFDVIPQEVDVVVNFGTTHIEQPFQVKGFSVRGRVLGFDGRTGVKGVALLVNGKPKAITDEDGFYKLEQLTSGNYKIEAQQEHIFFSSLVQQKLTPNVAQLPDILVTKYHLCGSITITLPPPGLNDRSERKILISGPGLAEERTATGGKYCFEVKPGAYKLTPVISPEEVSAGLLLSPRDLTVIITNAPVLEANFVQAKVSVSGSVRCIETPCHPSISVILSSVGGSSSTITTGLGVGVAAPELLGSSSGHGRKAGMSDYFVFRDVLPGTYRITINQESWCWEKDTFLIEVQGDDISDIEFVQSGYLLSVLLSHDISLEIANSSSSSPSSQVSKQQKALTAGKNKICLSQPGVYQLTPKSCYLFSKESFSYDTSSPKPLELSATRYLVNGSIVVSVASSEKDLLQKANLKVRAERVNEEDNVNETHPVTLSLLSSKAKAATGGAEPETEQTYQFSYWAGFKDVVTFVPTSSEFLFYPPNQEIQIQEKECPGRLPPFQARPGLFLKGNVKPSFSNIKIQVRNGNTGDVVLSTETRADGTYTAGPLYDDQAYELSAEKDGYSFQPDKANKYNFHALRLAKIKVVVQDEANQPLSGVLITLTGDGGYRSNNVTLPDGTQIFSNLVPGQFFLRIQLKEYVFQPSTHAITLGEGGSEEFKFKGQRVAFSCYGQVQALNGEPEKFIVVEAKSEDGGASAHHEETQSDANGTFRIRGLLPDTRYVVRVKTQGQATPQGQGERVERSTPSTYTIGMKKEDVSGLDFIVFRRSNKVDLTGQLVTSVPSWYDAIKLELYSQQNPDQPLKVVSFVAAPTPSPFFEISSLPRDGKYFIRVKTSLSPQVYSFSSVDLPLVLNESSTAPTPSSSSTTSLTVQHQTSHHVHVIVSFSATLHPIVQENTPTSAPFTLLFGILLVVCVFYHRTLLEVVRDLVKGKRTFSSLLSFESSSSSPSAASSSQDDNYLDFQKSTKKKKT